MQINPNELYFFIKSGNEVRAIAPAGKHHGVPLWEVERTRGTSAGKRMLVAARALVKRLD